MPGILLKTVSELFEDHADGYNRFNVKGFTELRQLNYVFDIMFARLPIELLLLIPVFWHIPLACTGTSLAISRPVEVPRFLQCYLKPAVSLNCKVKLFTFKGILQLS